MTKWTAVLLVLAMGGACLAQGFFGERRIVVPSVPATQPDGAPTTGPDGESAETKEHVHTLGGSVLSGRVLGIGADGVLRLADEQFDGEVRVRVAALDRVSLLATDKPDGRDTVLVSNGDSLFGRVPAVSDERITIDTAAAGTLGVGRQVAQAVRFGQEGSLTIDSEFARGVMDPWKPVNGQWSVADGHLVLASSGGYHVIAARVDQREAITVELSLESTAGDIPDVGLAVFVDRPGSDQFGRNGVYAWFNDDEDRFHLGYSRDGDKSNVLDVSKDPSAKNAVLRLSYDPATGKAIFWHNSVLLGETVIPRKFASGQYVLFNSYYPCKVKYIRIGGGALGAGAAEEDPKDVSVAQFTNSDSVVVRGVVLENGTFTLQTDTFGQVTAPADKVSGLVFAARHLDRPRRQAGDVVVEGALGRLTLKLHSMDEQFLTGACDYLGEVKIRRSSIRSIRFNIYR